MGDAASTPAMQHARALLQSEFFESKHQKVFPDPSQGFWGRGTAGAATTHPVFQVVSDRGFQVAPGGHSSGPTFLAGLILGRMRHAQRPQAVPPARGTAGPLQLQQALSQPQASLKPCPVCCCQRHFCSSALPTAKSKEQL